MRSTTEWVRKFALKKIGAFTVVEITHDNYTRIRILKDHLVEKGANAECLGTDAPTRLEDISEKRQPIRATSLLQGMAVLDVLGFEVIVNRSFTVIFYLDITFIPRQGSHSSTIRSWPPQPL